MSKTWLEFSTNNQMWGLQAEVGIRDPDLILILKWFAFNPEANPRRSVLSLFFTFFEI